MNKTQLIDKVAKDNGMTKKQVAETLDAMLAAMGETFASGESIQIAGFGAFTVKDKPAHIGRNPMTGENVEIAASRKVTFAAGKTLKDKINETR